jgi:phosphate transport system substrate-binding protein
LVVHPAVEVASLSREEVVGIFSGQITTWPSGRPVVPLLREEGDSATSTATRTLSGLGDALQTSRRMQRFRTLLTDEQMSRALQATPSSIGFHDLGAITLENRPLRAVALDGVSPDIASLRSGRYPLTRTLLMVHRQAPSAGAAAFVDFVRSPPGREVIERGGYLPLLDEAS